MADKPRTTDYSKNKQHTLDPVRFARWLWPEVKFYRQQQEVIYSVVDNDETVVTAGHMLGKDFVAAFVVLWFFLTRHPVRVVTTSADSSQLEGVLWGEIKRMIQTCKYPLESTRGGPVVVNHMHLRKIRRGQVDALSYCIGRVAAKGEGMQGHHVAETGDGVPRTLFVGDEASGIDDLSYNAAESWARRKLIIGNPYPCSNFFFRGVRAGDLAAPPPDRPPDSVPFTPQMVRTAEALGGVTGPATAPPPAQTVRPERMYRKVIRIRGEDSPNVRLAQAQKSSGQPVTHEILVPGVLPYADYRKRRDTWDPVKQCIGIDGMFYEGAEALLYPPDWRNKSEQLADRLRQESMPDPGENILRDLSRALRRARGPAALGVDPAEGGDHTTFCVVDEVGVLDLVTRSTPDTSVIRREAVAIARKYDIPPERWVFDAGGGGRQIVDELRSAGHRLARSVAFGAAVTPDPKKGIVTKKEEIDRREQRYAYRNRRAEMYGLLRILLEPLGGESRFGIPASDPDDQARSASLMELQRQLGLLPLLYDNEGRLYLPPKRRQANSQVRSLEEILGRSPDEADSLVLAAYGLKHRAKKNVVGAMW